MNKYQAYIFDLDGVLVDSYQATDCLFKAVSREFSINDINSFRFALRNSLTKHLGYIFHGEPFLEFGIGAYDLILAESDYLTLDQEKVSLYYHSVFQDLGDYFYDFSEFLLCVDFFKKNWLHFYEIYTDVLTCLERIPYNQRYILSNGFRYLQEQKIKFCGLDQLFPYHQMIISEGVGNGKPDILPYKKIISISKLEKNQVIMIGDSLHTDIEGALRAGIHYRYLNRYEKIQKDHYTIYSLNNLIASFNR